jgi:hypothetical protein
MLTRVLILLKTDREIATAMIEAPNPLGIALLVSGPMGPRVFKS